MTATCALPGPKIPLYLGISQGDGMATAGAKLVQLKAMVAADLHRALKVYAAQSGTPMNALVTEAVRTLLKRKGAL